MPNASCVKLHERVVVTETGGAVHLRFRSPCCKAWLSLEVLGSWRRITHARSRHSTWTLTMPERTTSSEMVSITSACWNCVWTCACLKSRSKLVDLNGPSHRMRWSLWACGFATAVAIWRAMIICDFVMPRMHSRWSRPGAHEVIQIALGPLGCEWVLRRILF